MYAFAQRPDTSVFDEPLYAAWAVRFPDEHRIYREQLIASQCNDGNEVVRELVLGPSEKDVLLFKHMGKHIDAVDDINFLMDTTNLVLLREPQGLLNSFIRAQGKTKVEDTCLPQQVQLFHTLRDQGRTPLVLVAEDLLQDPAGMLRSLCHQLGLDFDQKMLTWEAGGRPEDGVWAFHWYKNTHKATGFDPKARTAPAPMPAGYEGVLQECNALFDQLVQHALKPMN